MVPTAEDLDCAIKAVRDTDPEIGVKRLTSQLCSSRTDWDLNTKAVKDALTRLAAAAAAAAAPAAEATAADPAPAPTPARARGRKKGWEVAEARLACLVCAKGVKGSPTRILCVCTRVLFCSEECEAHALQPGGVHDCKGPPRVAPIDIEEALREKLRDTPLAAAAATAAATGGQVLDESGEMQAYMAEMQATVQSKWHFPSGPKECTLAEFTRCAERSPACAFQAGLMLKTQMTGTPEYHPSGRVTLHRDEAGFSVLEDEAQSIKYFTMAAEAGLGLAMLSLGESLAEGKGVRKDRRRGLCWFWQGALLGSAKCLPAANQYSIMPLEVQATMKSMQYFLGDPAAVARSGILPGQTYSPTGPNLGSLLCALIRPLSQSGFMLPPFAAASPGGSTPTLTQVPILAREVLRELLRQIKRLEKRDYFVKPMYGRCGTGKEATVAAKGTKKNMRSIDCQLFVAPPKPPQALRGTDAPTEEQASAWRAVARRIKFPVECTHPCAERLPVCDACLATARERLAALDSNGVVLSLQETLDGDGQLAIYRSTSGELVSETFRSYSRPEVESALGALVLAGPKDLAHPLFVAQDPNLLWPAVYYHGSVRAALTFVAPHVMWGDRLPPPHSSPVAEPLLATGSVARRCGADACLSLQCVDAADEAGAFRFLKCSGCMRRRYCSTACQRGDFPLHKAECSGTPRAPAAEPAAAPMPVTDFAEDESILIQGVVAKPELNGRAGVVRGPINEAGRHPVELDGRTSALALKPANLLRLGVRCAGKHGRRYECSTHGGEVCEPCCLDLSIANHLGKLRHSQGALLSESSVERVAHAHFAKMPRVNAGNGYLDPAGPLLAGVPAQGPANRRGVLQAALASPEKEIVEAVAAAIVGLACFGVRAMPIAEPSVLPHLVHLANMV